MQAVENDRAENHQPPDDLLHVGRDVEQDHPVREHADEEHAEQRSRELALAADDVGAADDHRGDDVEFPADADFRRTGHQARRENEPGDAGDRRADDKDADLHAFDVNAGEASRVLVAAQRVDRTAEGRRGHDEGADQEDGDHVEHRIRDEAKLPGAVDEEVLRQAANRVAAGQRIGHAANQRHRRHRDEEGVQAEARGDVPGEHAPQAGDAERGEDRERDRQPPLEEDRIEHGGERDERADRKIDLAHDQDHRHADGDDSLVRDLPEHVNDVRNRQELRRRKREIDDEQHKDDRERVLEEKLLNADLIRRSAGAIRGRHACIAFHDDSFLIFSD